MSLTKTRPQETTVVIKESLVHKIKVDTRYPCFYSVIEFGFYDDEGFLLPPSQISKYWDKTVVHKTCRLIRNMIKECFSISNLYFFIERHASQLDEHGNEISKGRFHLNIITSDIKDDVIQEPNRKLRRLLLQNGRDGVAIQDMAFNTLDDLKIELFNTCCRQANWINRYKYSIKTQILNTQSDLENTVMYCLKDYDEVNGSCFTEIVDFKNSDFNKH